MPRVRLFSASSLPCVFSKIARQKPAIRIGLKNGRDIIFRHCGDKMVSVSISTKDPKKSHKRIYLEQRIFQAWLQAKFDTGYEACSAFFVIRISQKVSNVSCSFPDL